MRSSARLLAVAVATAGVMAVGSPAFAGGHDCPHQNDSSEVDRPVEPAHEPDQKGVQKDVRSDETRVARQSIGAISMTKLETTSSSATAGSPQPQPESAGPNRQPQNGNGAAGMECMSADIAVAVLSCNPTMSGDASGLLGILSGLL